MKKNICLISLIFAILSGSLFTQVTAISPVKDAAEDVKTITIEVPHIPWDVSLAMADKPVKPGDRVFTISRDDTQPMITLEIELVDSIAGVPLNPGQTTVVTDGSLIYVLKDEITAARDTTYASREADVYDLKQPLIWYGTIRMYSIGVYDGSIVDVTSYGSYVMAKPKHSTLSVISSAIGTNNIIAVTTKSVFAITLDNGLSHINFMSLTTNAEKMSAPGRIQLTFR